MPVHGPAGGKPRRAGKAIAFRRGVRNYLYPARQFAPRRATARASVVARRVSAGSYSALRPQDLKHDDAAEEAIGHGLGRGGERSLPTLDLQAEPAAGLPGAERGDHTDLRTMVLQRVRPPLLEAIDHAQADVVEEVAADADRSVVWIPPCRDP